MSRALSSSQERSTSENTILLNRGEEKTGGRRKHALLADAYEALIGVLYIDGGTVVAERFLRRELGEKLMSIDPASMIGADYKSALQERLQAAGGTVPEYVVVEVTGPDHRRTFRVELRVVGEALATGEGHTIKIAQQEAARAGLESDSLSRVIEAIKLSRKRELEPIANTRLPPWMPVVCRGGLARDHKPRVAEGAAAGRSRGSFTAFPAAQYTRRPAVTRNPLSRRCCCRFDAPGTTARSATRKPT